MTQKRNPTAVQPASKAAPLASQDDAADPTLDPMVPLQARYDVRSSFKAELQETAVQGHTDMTSIIEAVMEQTRGQWFDLFLRHLAAKRAQKIA